jgi:glycerol uptake facilitator protein
MNPFLAEFIGTAVLILLGNGVVANVVLNRSKGQNGGWIVITAGWGLGAALGVYSVGRISGAHLNPAVTFGLASVGDFEWALVPGYLIAQVAGAAAGATLVWLNYLAHWSETSDADSKLACFSTSPAVPNHVAAFITEFIATAMFLFGVLAIGSIAKGVPDTTVAEVVPASLVGIVSNWWSPFLVGLLVFSMGLSLGGPTGYAINPARDLGPRIAHQILPVAGKGSSNWSYAWVPIVAPILGGIAGAQLHRLLIG